MGEKICYHRGRKEQGLYGFALALLSSNPRQALTRLEGTPDTYQYSGVPLRSHCSSTDESLHIAS